MNDSEIRFNPDANFLTEEQKRRLRIKIRSLKFDGRNRTPPPQGAGFDADRGMPPLQQNNNNHDNGGPGCKTSLLKAGETAAATTTTTTATTSTVTLEQSQPPSSSVVEQNSSGHDRCRMRNSVTRSRSDDRGSKTTPAFDVVVCDVERRYDLHSALKSLSLAPVSKSLSDSELNGCGFESRTSVSSGHFVSPTFETGRTCSSQMRQQVVKMLEEGEEEFVDQLKCPVSNDRGSLGSSASLELVRLEPRVICSADSFNH